MVEPQGGLYPIAVMIDELKCED